MAVYSDIWDGPARNYRRDDGEPVRTRKRYVVVHNTSNDATAEGEASYAKRRTDGTSSHYYADHDSLVQSLDTYWCAGHVGSWEGNTYGISYEITGFNSWSRAKWLSSVAWDLAAAQMARDCREHGIEPRLLTIAQMRAGDVTGFVTHDMCRLAWGETTHTDPGPGFPMDHLISLVRKHLYGGWLMALSDEQQEDLYRRVCNMDYYLYGGVVLGWDEIEARWLRMGFGKGEHPAEPVPVAVTRLLHDLAARGPVELSEEQLDRLADKLAARMQPITRGDVENATEAGIRRVLGAVDGATPGAGS